MPDSTMTDHTAAAAPPQAFTTRPQIRGTFGVVASTHWLASASGMAVLEAGGNAFDAAVAAGLVLQVVEPHMNGLGGEAPIIAYDAAHQQPFVVCGQGGAPQAATISAFADLGLDLVPGTGLLAACVPGAFGAWMRLLADHGTLGVAEVMRYALTYAEGGFPLGACAAAAIARAAPLFAAHWPSSAQVYLPRGKPPAPGARFANRQLAATYRRLLAEAQAAGTDRNAQIDAACRAFYQGFLAETIAEFVASTPVMDTSGHPHHGLLSYEDMATWRPRVEAPLTYDYAGYTVCKPGPWSQGPVFLQQLALLAGFDLGGMDPCGAEFVHVVTECAKLAFADREAYYGDPDHVRVPLEALLSADYAAARRALVTAQACPTLRPGTVEGYPAVLPGRITHAASDHAAGDTPSDTCHLDVADRHGNLVSATPSGGWLQGSPVIPGLGFSLTTRAQMFWLEEGLANSLAPGKRPRTTLTPTLVLQDGRPYLALGTPGGDNQDQWSLLTFLRHLHHHMSLQQAIEAPRWHSAHAPSSFWPRDAHPNRLHAESRLGEATLAELRRRGHDIVVEGPWSLGRVSAAAIEPDGTLAAAADARGVQGYAVGR